MTAVDTSWSWFLCPYQLLLDSYKFWLMKIQLSFNLQTRWDYFHYHYKFYIEMEAIAASGFVYLGPRIVVCDGCWHCSRMPLCLSSWKSWKIGYQNKNAVNLPKPMTLYICALFDSSEASAGCHWPGRGNGTVFGTRSLSILFFSSLKSCLIGQYFSNMSAGERFRRWREVE